MATTASPNRSLSRDELAALDRDVIAGRVSGNPALAKAREKIRCQKSPAYFVEHYVKIKAKGYVNFRMWPDQVKALNQISFNRFIAILKARQIGMTTLVAAWAVHSGLFTPGFVTLLFSKGHLEAKKLLRRIRLIFLMLPEFLRPGFDKDTTTELGLTNGSEYISFGSMASGGDSFTADAVIIDEADLIRNLDDVLSGAKPTIDAGGKLILLSRTEKTDFNSPFKRICRAALAGVSEFTLIFLAWFSRPGRTKEWYEALAREIEQRTFAKDELYANYPTTPDEALSARELDKRFPISVLDPVFFEEQPIKDLKDTPFAGWANLKIYRLPQPGETFVVGGDVAGGNPHSDDSTAVVLNKATLEEVATLAGKIEPTVHAMRTNTLAKFFNNAEIMPEKNHTHGAKYLEALKALKAKILFGYDRKPGWFTDLPRKHLMYDNVAEAVRTQKTIIHSKELYDQLGSLDALELEAPFGFKDDIAMGYGLAVQGACRRKTPVEFAVLTSEAT